MLRLIRDSGIAARLAMIMMILILLAVGISIGWYVKDRSDAATRLFAHSAARRIVNIVELLDQSSVASAHTVVRAVSGPTLRVRLAPGPPPPDPDLMDRHRILKHTRHLLRGLGERPIVLSRIGDWKRPLFGEHDEDSLDREPDILPSRSKMIVATTLESGQWVHFVLATDLTSLRWALRTAFWVLCLGGVVIFFSIWAAYRATRPLRRLASAADTLGLNVDAPPLKETGSRELKKTARAFNQMQQRIKRLLDDRTLMLAALSHDLKTMLTRLRLRAEFIDDDEQQGKAVRDIDDMQVMVDASLSFVRGDQANEALHRMDLATMIRDLAEDSRAQGHDIGFDGPERLTVEGRPVALKRAIGNLIDNAVRYAGAARLSLKEEGDRAILCLSDSGPGLPEEELEKVFQPFYRVESSRSRDTGGSGLGLALARDVFRRLGGDLNLENKHEGGLVATAWLPLSPKG